MSEQAATALDSGNLSDLASFLGDTPEEESNDQELEALEADEPTGDADTGEEAHDDSDHDDSEQSDEAEEAAPVEKITVKVKGDDGQEETLELTPEDISASYLRQKDYTRKTQALAERENQAVEFIKTKHDEFRNQYLTQAEIARTAVIQMAGLKTGEEMAQLAHSDPAAWVAENQRQIGINNYLNQLNQQIEGEKQRAVQEQQQHLNRTLQQQYQQTWNVLQQEKIDKPQLAKIYDGVSKNYGFSPEELGNVYDHRLVKMMRDAQAYQDLKARKSDVVKKVSDAPRMPQKQAYVKSARDQQLEQKFKGGRAKLNDLAALLR